MFLTVAHIKKSLKNSELEYVLLIFSLWSTPRTLDIFSKSSSWLRWSYIPIVCPHTNVDTTLVVVKKSSWSTISFSSFIRNDTDTSSKSQLLESGVQVSIFFYLMQEKLLKSLSTYFKINATARILKNILYRKYGMFHIFNNNGILEKSPSPSSWQDLAYSTHGFRDFQVVKRWVIKVWQTWIWSLSHNFL